MKKLKSILFIILSILLLFIFSSAYVYKIISIPLNNLFDWFILAAYSLVFIPIALGYVLMIIGHIKEISKPEENHEKSRSMETNGETSSLS